MNLPAERKNFIKCMNSTTHKTTASNSFSFDLVVTSSIYPVIKTQHGHSQKIPCCSLFSKDRLIRNKKYFEFNKTSLKTQLINFSAKDVDIVLCVNFEVMQNEQIKSSTKEFYEV